MLISLLLLLSCQLLGDWLVSQLGMPLPGPVVGMFLLLGVLAGRGAVPSGLERITAPLLRHMSLFFIPVGAGVLLYVDRVVDEWLAITVVLIAGTLATLLATGWLMGRGISPESAQSCERP